MPSAYKGAHVKPLIKKQSLDKDIFKNFRPISNLAFISKVIEKVVCNQIKQHLTNCDLMELYQSAYRQFHGVETAVLKVQNDILVAIDKHLCVLLVLIDLSAAFDTIEYEVLFRRLCHHFGISGDVLAWIKDYLLDRTQRVVIGDSMSSPEHLKYGVPQGSILGPMLFTLYMAPLCDLLKKHGVQYHCYADDTQIYLSFEPQDVGIACQIIEKCLSEVRAWMALNCLCLNDSKTEVIVFGSKHNLAKFPKISLSIGDATVSEVSEVRNLGATMDSELKMTSQIAKTCKVAWFHLRKIKQIKAYMDPESLVILVHAYITSKIDFMNGLLYGVPEKYLNSIRRVQHAAARMLTGAKRQDHITPILKQLHWLPLQYRIMYKILLYVYKALHGKAPKYLKDMIRPVVKSRTLRSSSKPLLIIPKTRTVRHGDRAFSHAAPLLWNQLPLDIMRSETTDLFKKLLKTHLFKLAFKCDN